MNLSGLYDKQIALSQIIFPEIDNDLSEASLYYPEVILVILVGVYKMLLLVVPGTYPSDMHPRIRETGCFMEWILLRHFTLYYMVNNPTDSRRSSCRLSGGSSKAGSLVAPKSTKIHKFNYYCALIRCRLTVDMQSCRPWNTRRHPSEAVFNNYRHLSTFNSF